jgi:hypothetical protein
MGKPDTKQGAQGCEHDSFRRAVGLTGHKALTAFWITWTLAIATFAVYRLFDDPASITAHGVAALSAVLAMPAGFIALYKWIRPKVTK